MTKTVRTLSIFAYGVFSIAAQTLLFREFISTLESSDISVGVFFGTWFLWIAIGAALVCKSKTVSAMLLKNTGLFLLAYLPAFVLQLTLTVQARRFAGIAAYEALPLWSILALSIIVNSPLGLVTGMLFPVICRQAEKGRRSTVSYVYIIESAGSFIGGTGATVLLGFGVNPAAVFLILAVMLSLAVFTDCVVRRKEEDKRNSAVVVTSCAAMLSLLTASACLALRADTALTGCLQTIKWTRMLAAQAPAGYFQTPQAEYLYGNYKGQWLTVREGSVCEALPDESTSGRIAAVSLCQNPAASRVLVIGTGLGVCRDFLKLPQIDRVSWAHSDGGYVRMVNRSLPEDLKIIDGRFSPQTGDVRPLLAEEKRYYDIIIVNLPDAAGAVFNRYYTIEFYRQVKEALRDGGVLAVRITGGENVLGTELAGLGASVKFTLEKIFLKFALTPGDETWFIASDSGRLTGEPAILRERFASIKGGEKIFAADGLLSVYLPQRAADAVERYKSAGMLLPERMLINSDAKPLAHLYSLLLAARRAGAPCAAAARLLALAGPAVFFVPISVFAALSIFYCIKTPQRSGYTGFDCSFLVFSAGWTGIGIVIVLMYLYQTVFGSLYLYVGVISSLYMAGLVAGGVLFSYFVSARRYLAVILAHMIIFAAIAFLPPAMWTHTAFAAAFVLCGVCAGSYFPLAAGRLSEAAFETGRSAGKLETADHIGACAGGLLTGVVFLPALGIQGSVFVLAALVLAAAPLFILGAYRRANYAPSGDFGLRLRRGGYILLGAGVSIVLCSDMLVNAEGRLAPSLPQSAAVSLAGGGAAERVQTVDAKSGRPFSYFKVYGPKNELAGYIFSSMDLSPQVYGFGGRMNLAVYADTAGKLISFQMISSHETPSYLGLLAKWQQALTGRQLFSPEPFADVSAVTGATVSSKAILAALQGSSSRFAGQILGMSIKSSAGGMGLPDRQAVYLACAFLLSLFAAYCGGPRVRVVVCVFNLVVGGVILNAQYSTEQIVTILSFNLSAAALSWSFFAAAGIPLVVAVFGNIYCGYMCPFGAMQELLGRLVPKGLQGPSQSQIYRMGSVRYGLLFVFIAAFFITRDRTTLAADPLISIFNWRFSISDLNTMTIAIAAVVLAASLLYRRFWCRYLCPAGAFLTLLGGLSPLKGYMPKKECGRCGLGAAAAEQTDCSVCREHGPEYAAVAGTRNLLSALVVTVVVLMLAVCADRAIKAVPSDFYRPAFAVSPAGQPRDVDMQRVRSMIEQKKLSDKEARFYKK